MNKEKLTEAVLEAHRRAYKESTPSIKDFDAFLKQGKAKKPNWFMKYKLNQDRQVQIIEDVAKEFKFKEWEIPALRFNTLLGGFPMSTEQHDMQ